MLRSGRRVLVPLPDKEVCLDTRRSVLIVDRSAESREVLRAVLEPRGLRILEANAAAEGLELARRYTPDVIVLDPELGRAPAAEVAGAFARQTARQATQLVVLGAVRGKVNAPQAGGLLRRVDSGSQAEQYLAKPYHYAPLIRRIEALLANTQTSSTKAA